MHTITEPGIYRGLSYQDYDAIPALRESSLAAALGGTWADCKWGLTHPKDTAALRFGRLWHCAVFEPGQLSNRILMAPACARRSNEDKATWVAHEKQCAEAALESCTQDDLMALLEMGRIAQEHDEAGPIIRETGDCELTLVWNEQETGLLCKARLDKLILSDASEIAEGKTCAAIDDRSFAGAIVKWKYYLQAAWYAAGVRAVLGVEADFTFIAQLSRPPYHVRVFDLSPDAVMYGEGERQRLLAEYAKCLKTDRWPAYPGRAKVDLPAWFYAAREIGDEALAPEGELVPAGDDVKDIYGSEGEQREQALYRH